MGYCMSQTGTDFFMSKDDVPKAKAALIKLAEKGKKEGWGLGWVDMEVFKEETPFCEMLEECRWEPELSDNGDIVYLSFNGEKLGDDEALFRALAPFVKDGSYIQMSGEDGALWRWVFKNGKCKERWPKTVWED